MLQLGHQTDSFRPRSRAKADLSVLIAVDTSMDFCGHRYFSTLMTLPDATLGQAILSQPKLMAAGYPQIYEI